MGRCWSTSTSLRSEHGGRRPSREEVAPGEDGITNSSATTTTEILWRLDMTSILGEHDCCRGRWSSSIKMRTPWRRQGAGWP